MFNKVNHGDDFSPYVDNISNLSSADDFEFCVVKRANASTDYADWDAFDATTSIPSDNQGGRTYITYDGFGMPIGSGYAQRTGYTSFSKFAIAKSDNTPLPVQLISFTAKLKGDKVELNWITLVEITPKGRDALKDIHMEKEKNVKEYMNIVSIDKKEEILGMLKQIRKALR